MGRPMDPNDRNAAPLWRCGIEMPESMRMTQHDSAVGFDALPHVPPLNICEMSGT